MRAAERRAYDPVRHAFERARRRKQEKRRYHANPEKVLQRQHRARLSDPEKFKKQARLRYANNREKIRDRERNRRANNLQKYRDYARRAYHADPEKARERRRKDYAKHRNRRIATNKVWAAANLDRVRNYKRLWTRGKYASNPEKYREVSREYHKRHYVKRIAVFNMTGKRVSVSVARRTISYLSRSSHEKVRKNNPAGVA